MRASEFIKEKVNPDVTSKKYFIEPTENVRMDDFEFNARTFTGGLGNPNAKGLQIRAYDPTQPKGQNLIGSADFIVKSDKKGNQWLESDDTEVNDEYRGKGVAAMMYAFAKSLGNDIKPSPYQSQMGRQMWAKWGKDAKNLAINESLSRIAYHYTGPQAALKILKNGVFELSSALGSPAEQQYMPKGKPYFMSATRTKLGGYHRGSVHSRGVMFVLDGDWFNRHYLSRPIDYWENRGNMYSGRASEAEDRIFSAEPTIPIGGVQSVHVYLDVEPADYNDKEQDANQRAVVRELLITAKTQGIPAYFYTDKNAWLNLDTRKQGDVKTLTGARKPGWYRPMRRRTYMQNWIELMGAKTQNQLSKDADKFRYNLKYDYDKQAAAQSLAIDMSNARKPDSGPERNDAVKIIAYMRQNGLNTLGEFVNHIADKWKAVN